MSPLTAAGIGALATLAIVALATGPALRRRREAAESAAAALIGAAIAAVDVEGVLSGVWLVVGLAGLYLAAHWMTDVLAGWALAGAWGCLLIISYLLTEQAPVATAQPPAGGYTTSIGSS